MLSSLLFYRWLIFNSMMLVLAGALSFQGLVLPLFEGDSSRLTFAIVTLFAAASAATLVSVVNVSAELNRSKRLGYRPATEREAEKALLKSEWVALVPEFLVGLGLLGTVVGFSMALAGVDQGSLGQASGAQTAVAHLMQGMRVALNTTLLGAALAIWHEVNVRMLRTAIGCYWHDRVRANLGEIPARKQD